MVDGYLHWAKVHRRVKYELTNSGVPPAHLDDIGAVYSPADTRVRGPYGNPALIKRIAERYALDESRFVPVLGASNGIFLALAATITRGDPVALEFPCYDPVARAVRFLGAEVVQMIRNPNNRFRVQLHDIETHLKSGVRVLFLTNIHNPSGHLTDIESMRSIVQLCDKHGTTLIVDEVYLDAAHLNLDRPRWSAAQLGDNVVAINSLTKIHGMGGIRSGWIIASERVTNRVRELINITHGDNPAPSEGLAARAFSHLEALEDRFRRFYRESQPIFRDWLGSEPLLGGYTSFGAIFEAVKLPRTMSSIKLNEKLVADYDTQVVPGSFFGLDDHIRITIAVPPADLQEALYRISQAIRSN